MPRSISADRRCRLKTFMLAGILAALSSVWPSAVLAERSEPPEEERIVSLPAGKVINADYFAAGRVVEIFGTVNGDVYAAGGQVIIDGQINGDLLAAGGTVSIAGKIAQDVRTAGGQITINGEIGRNLTVAGGNVELTGSARIGRALVAGAGNLIVAAPVGGDVTLAAGKATVSNTVNGNLKAATGELRLTSRAVVTGDLAYWSKQAASMDEGAKVGGVVTRKTMPEFPVPSAGKLLGALAALILIAKLVSFASTLILGLLFIYLLPRYTHSTVSILKTRPWVSLGIGFIALVMTPVAAGILLSTVLGAPLALILLAIYLIAIYLVRVFVILWAASALFEWSGRPVREVWAMVIGLVVYFFLTLIPFIGGLVTLFVILFGLGAALLADRALYLAAREKEVV